MLQDVMPGGVTSLQCAPPSRVTQISPSVVPAQIVFTLLNDGPML